MVRLVKKINCKHSIYPMSKINHVPVAELRPADVLIDNVSLLRAKSVFCSGSPVDVKESKPAATLLESVVLYERLIVDPLKPHSDIKGVMYDTSHFSKVNELVCELPSDVICFLDLSDESRLNLLHAVGLSLPYAGFSWEWLLNPFVWDTDDIYEDHPILDSLLSAMTKGRNEPGIPGSDFFRFSGSIIKQVYYIGLSRLAGIPYIPNYERNAVYKAYIAGYNNPNLAVDIEYWQWPWDDPDMRETAQAAVLKYFENHVLRSVDELVRSVLPWAGISVPMPPLFSHIVRLSKNRKVPLLDVALDLRQSKTAIAFRKWSNEVSEAYRASDRRSLVKLLRGLIRECERWKTELRHRQKGGRLSLSFFGIGIQIDEDIPDLVSALRRKFSKHLLFLRDLV